MILIKVKLQRGNYHYPQTELIIYLARKNLKLEVVQPMMPKVRCSLEYSSLLITHIFKGSETDQSEAVSSTTINDSINHSLENNK